MGRSNDDILYVMKRYLALRPIATTRCFSSTSRHDGKGDKSTPHTPSSQNSRTAQQSKEDAEYLSSMGSTLDGPPYTPGADGKNDIDPFAVYDAPYHPKASAATTPPTHSGDRSITVETLKEQLQKFDKGENVQLKAALSVRGLDLKVKSREMKMARKPYRYLTTRDMEVARQEEEKYQRYLEQATRANTETSSKPQVKVHKTCLLNGPLIRKVMVTQDVMRQPKTASLRAEWVEEGQERTDEVVEALSRKIYHIQDTNIERAVGTELAGMSPQDIRPTGRGGLNAPSGLKGNSEQKELKREPPIPTSTTNPTSSLSPRQLATLPQSPLILKPPNFWNEKAYSEKPPPSGDLTPFQKKLTRNAYAHALASPLRTCTITKIMLPRDLMLALEDIENPVDGKKWYMPRSLTLPVKSSKIRIAQQQLGAYAQPLDSDEISIEASVDELTNHITRIGQRHYVLLRKDLVTGLGTKGSRYFGGWNSFHLIGASRGMKGTQQAGMHNWRGDMDTFVLKLLRRRVVEIIAKAVYGEPGFVHYCPSWDEVIREKQMGCVLWLGHEPASNPTKSVEDVEVETQKAGRDMKTLHQKWREEDALPDIPGPGHYATITNTPFWEQKLPVHNALRLLGPEFIAEIRARGPKCENRELMVIKSKQETLKLRMLLWNLEHYLLDPEAEGSGWMPKDDAAVDGRGPRDR